ncbi:OsmC family protein [Aestuariispira insulae]|uniref:Organic hydroperoxide reductase OsmC/OhrA n=1 Tax=Aestuariispira insulae TaxID=1461337 RepID=A0A3D9HGB3_9PROT|nr:OsmC family protein [Aestuariispira insulae]RED48500.1 organic hydroperoxide reductase OsmC/OhrA [Aestuariispira insulae]
MSELMVELEWERSEPELSPGTYSNAHILRFTDDLMLEGDAAPDWGGDAMNANPEQSLGAALSSCHMMTFLALAAKAGWPVASYRDHAIAHLGKNPKGQTTVTRIDLHPVVRFDKGFTVAASELEVMQDRAHRYCFIANALADEVEVNIL